MKILSLVMALVLMFTLSLTAFAEDVPVLTVNTVYAVDADEQPIEVEWDENEETILLTDGAVYGIGETSFTFVVIVGEEETTVTVNTDAETVGEALAELCIIAGEESEWGLYVKTVNGVTADYDEDGTYWAFYIDDEYAMTGVDATEIEADATYTFAVEGMDFDDSLLTMEEGETVILTDGEVYGEGSLSFGFTVTDADGNETSVTVKTDAETVGEALVALNLIAGDESEWGLYVKTVNGITADYDTDGHYWAFYIDGEYAMTGVDATEITEGSVYAFVVE